VNVLFIGITNSGRSLMAEQLFRSIAGDRHRAASAGTYPAAAIYPPVAEALAEVGIDTRDLAPPLLNDDVIAMADVVVLTCDDGCLIGPGKRLLSWRLPSTEGASIKRVRKIRDAIRVRVEALVRELDELAATRRASPTRSRAIVEIR
jgi:arsenate reductase